MFLFTLKYLLGSKPRGLGKNGKDGGEAVTDQCQLQLALLQRQLPIAHATHLPLSLLKKLKTPNSTPMMWTVACELLICLGISQLRLNPLPHQHG